MRKLTQKNENSTPSSAFSFFLSESEEESCRGVAEAAAAAMADKTRKEKATRGNGGVACDESEARTYSNY
jgi:hypothetical protein